MAIELTTSNVLWLICVFVMANFALAKIIAHVYDRRFTERFVRAEKRLSLLESGLKETDNRLSRAESALEALPGHDDLGKLYERVNALAEGIQALSGEFSGAKHTLNLLHQFLLEGGRR